MAGAAPGSIIAVIIVTHTAAKNVNEPSRVATPMSIPVICQTEITQQAAASPSVAVSAAAAVVLTRISAPLPRPLGSDEFEVELASAPPGDGGVGGEAGVAQDG